MRNYWFKMLSTSALGSVLNTLFNVLITFSFIKNFDEYTLGQFTTLTSIAAIFTVISKLGLDNSLLHFLNKFRLKFISGIFLICFLCSVIISIFYTLSFRLNLHLAFAFIVVGNAMNELFFSLYKWKNRVGKYFYIKILFTQFLFLLLLNSNLKLGFQQIAIIYGFLVMLQSLLNFLLFKKAFKKVIFKQEIFYYSWPLLLSASFGVLINNLDYLMIGHFKGNGMVGEYRIIYQISSLFLLILSIFNIAFAPRISKLYNNGKQLEIKILYFKSIKYLGSIALFIFLVVVIFGKFFISLFDLGGHFFYTSLIILSLGFVFYSSLAGTGHILSLTGKPILQFFRLILSLLFNISLNFLLIPKHGILGASIATSTSFILSSVIGYFFVQKRLRELI